MNIIIKNDKQQWAASAADIIQEVIASKADPRLILPTGETPLPVYAELVRRYEAGAISFKPVCTYNLDEYVGLSHEHPQGYYYFMNKNLFSKIDILPENAHVLCGTAENLQAECAAYEQQASDIDLALIGIGNNGHIAFNEPGTPFDSVTHVQELTESTIVANSRLFDDISEVPRSSLTMGIGTIMRAKKILLIASGPAKAEAIYRALREEPTTDMPASALQLHPDVTLVLDEAAAAKLG